MCVCVCVCLPAAFLGSVLHKPLCAPMCTFLSKCLEYLCVTDGYVPVIVSIRALLCIFRSISHTLNTSNSPPDKPVRLILRWSNLMLINRVDVCIS